MFTFFKCFTRIIQSHNIKVLPICNHAFTSYRTLKFVSVFKFLTFTSYRMLRFVSFLKFFTFTSYRTLRCVSVFKFLTRISRFKTTSCKINCDRGNSAYWIIHVYCTWIQPVLLSKVSSLRTSRGPLWVGNYAWQTIYQLQVRCTNHYTKPVITLHILYVTIHFS